MKIYILAFITLLMVGCSETESSAAPAGISPTDSINDVRKKLNDSITLKNRQNRFGDLTGDHTLKFTSDEIDGFSGTVHFANTGRDLYTITGKAAKGRNSLKISGTVKRVSEKHLNFEGEISQNINGAVFKRTAKTTFMDEGSGQYWRLQNKINGSGFVDYIDIYF